MNILEKIAAHKKSEIALLQKSIPVSYLETAPLFNATCRSMHESIRKNPIAIIAEHKRRSPSRNTITSHLSVAEIVSGYEKAGASGISVLTDGHFFGGSLTDLNLARCVSDLPIIRKDFIIDEYQIIEAKSSGADAILLIAAILDPKTIATFAKTATSLGMEVLLEVHDRDELERSLTENIAMVGVNNRNLKTMTIDLGTSLQLIDLIPTDMVRISESGIKTTSEINLLKHAGFDAFLIGDQFMTTENPPETLSQLLHPSV